MTYKDYIKEQMSLVEAAKFDNWVKPSTKDIELEYKIEYQMKPLKQLTNDAFPELEDFKKAVKAARVVEVTPSMDRKIQYRSGTKTKEQLLGLIRGYASYPEFRNEKTIDAIYQGFAYNKPMKMPFVVKFKNGDMRIMGGNTRMDVAFQMGINPKVLVIEVK